MSQQILDAGEYTPTLTNVVNLDDSTGSVFQWFRVGNLVHVMGMVTVDPTAAGPTATQLGISLPIPSNFGSGDDANGTAASPTFTECGVVAADATNDRASLNFQAVSTTSHAMRLAFTYKIIE